MRILITAEAGVNRNGSVEVARRMIDVAVDASVDTYESKIYNSCANLIRKARFYIKARNIFPMSL